MRIRNTEVPVNDDAPGEQATKDRDAQIAAALLVVTMEEQTLMM